MANIAPGGIYRTIPVWIGGSNYEPPGVPEMLYHMKEFYRDIAFKCMLEATESLFGNGGWGKLVGCTRN